MRRTTVVNLKGHRDDPDFADVVYVGRALYRGAWRLAASPLANPYRPGPDGTRAQVIAAYREYLLGRPDLRALLPQLRGRRLGCWCAPLPCHADVIAELADTRAGQGSGQSHRPGPETVPYAMENSG
jgi:Domain of unknown function (DUF4326)